MANLYAYGTAVIISILGTRWIMYKRKLGAVVPRRDILAEKFFAFCNV